MTLAMNSPWRRAGSTGVPPAPAPSADGHASRNRVAPPPQKQPGGRDARAPLPLIALLLGAFFLRAFRLDHHVLWLDENVAATIAIQPVADIAARLRSSQADAPLFLLELHWWLGLAGYSAFALRWPSVLAATLLIPVAYRLGTAVAGHGAGLVAGVLIAVNPLALWYAQEARMYAQATLLLAVVLLGLTWIWRGRLPPGIALASGGATLGLLSHYVTAPALTGAWAVALLLAITGRLSWRRLVAFAVGQAMALAPFGLWWLSARSLVPPFQSGHDSGGLLPVLEYAAAGPAILVSPTLGWVLTGLTALAVAAGLGVLTLQRSRMSPWPFLLIIFMAVPIAEVWLIPRLTPLLGPRYLSVFLPEYLLLATLVALTLWTHWRPGGIAIVGAFALSAVLGYHAYQFDQRYGKWYDYRTVAAYIRAHEQKGDGVIVNSQYDPSFWYYYHYVDGGPAPTFSIPQQRPTSDAELTATLEQAGQTVDRLWLPDDAGHFWDVHWDTQRWLDMHDTRLEANALDDLQLDLYLTPLGILDRSRHATSVRFGDAAELAGWAARTSAPQSGHLTVVLDWRDQKRIPARYTVFVHLYDGPGRLVAQDDREPALGSMPTDTWQPGQRIIDQHDVALPAGSAGSTYRLTVGLYLPKTGQRLPVTGDGAPDNEVTLGTISG